MWAFYYKHATGSEGAMLCFHRHTSPQTTDSNSRCERRRFPESIQQSRAFATMDKISVGAGGSPPPRARVDGTLDLTL